MGKPTVINATPMTVMAVKEELARVKKRDEELTFRGGKVEEYLQQFKTITPKQAIEMEEKMTELKIPRLKEIHIKKIIDIMPKYLEDLKMVLQGYTITVKDDHRNEVSKMVTFVIE